MLFTTTALLYGQEARRRRKQQTSALTENMLPPNDDTASSTAKANQSSKAAPLSRAAHKLTSMFHSSDKSRLQQQQAEAQDVVDEALDAAYITTVHSAFSASTNTLSRSNRLRSLGAAIHDYKWMNMLDMVQALLGVMSTLLWMVQSYPPYRDNYSIFMIQFVLSCLYIADFFTRIAISGSLYLYSRWALIDALTILPILYTIYQLGWVWDNNRTERGYIQFLIDFQVIWQFLTLARFLRLYKLLRIAEFRRFTLWSNNVLSRGLTQLLLTVLTIIVLGAGLEYLIENNATDGNGMTFNQSLYFMVVTISTVGYGDITPKSIIGQVFCMIIILVAIILIPMQTSDFISNLQEYAKYGSAYPGGRVPHVVLVAHATMSPDDLDTLLHEFFHTNQGFTAYDVVILCNGGDEHRKKLLYHVKTTQFWAQVKYILGSPSNVSDLQKASISTAQAVFLITSARFLDAEQELAADEETLLRAISIKHFCPYVPLIMHVLSPRNKAHVLWYQLSKFPNIQVVCLNEMKMRLFASSCMCPGVLGLVTNLLSSYDGKASVSMLFASTSSSMETQHGSYVSSSTQTFAAAALKRSPLTLAAWPLSSARSPAYPSAPIPPPAADGSSSLFFPSAIRRWEEEYLFGFGQEIYTAEFPECVDGYSFAEVAAILYERLSVVLIGVYQADETTGKLQVALNPGYSGRVRIRGGDLACVIAQNADHAKAIKSVEYAHQLKAKDGQSTDIRDRWRKEREKDKVREQKERSRLKMQKRERLQRRMKRQQSQRAKFAHTIDIPAKPQSSRNVHAEQMQPQSSEEKDELDSQQPNNSGSSEGDRDRENGAMSPSWPLSDEDGEPEIGVLDALSSFRCNGQAVVPSMPASSYIAQLNVAEQQQERRQEEEEAQLADEQTEGPPPAAADTQPAPGHGRQLGDVTDEVVDDQTGHTINPVTGQITGQTTQPSLVERVLEGVGLVQPRRQKEMKEEEQQQDALDAVVSKHPEFEDEGHYASADDEDRKDASVFSPAGQTQIACDEPASADRPTTTASQPSPSDSSAPPSAAASAPTAAPPTPPRQPSFQPNRSSGSRPSSSNSPSSGPVDYADLDPYSGHIVVCGYIDSKIINFLRRLRDSDSRTVVLVFDNSVCFPLPPAVHAFIVTHFTNVYILFASSTYKQRHQKDRLYLAYTSPCFGHHHEPPVEEDWAPQKRPVDAVANAASVDGAPSELKAGIAATQPPMAMDEHSEHDKRVHHALHLSGDIDAPAVTEVDDEEVAHRQAVDHRRPTSSSSSGGGGNKDGSARQSPSFPQVAAYSLSISGSEGSRPMTYQEMLQHGSWFRRACVHRADSVLILANPYSSPAGSTSSASNGLDNPQASMTQHLLASILNATDRQSHSTDEMLKADQFGLTIYSAIQAYLQQCRTAACPALSMHVTATTFSIVNIELIHHSNVRLLKHDADTTEKYRPTEAVEAGWRWLWDAARHWYQKRQVQTQVARDKLAVRRKMKQKRRKVKRRHYAMMRGVALKDEEKLDRHSTDESRSTNAGNGGSDDEDENEEKKDRGGEEDDQGQSVIDQSLREEDFRFAKTLQDHFRAFYTADGLMFSGKILDALIVQAFFHPLVYDTVVSLVSGYAHTIPKQQFNRAMDEADSTDDDAMDGDGGGGGGGGGGRGDKDGDGDKAAGSDPNDRTFRVELLLVDVPAVMAGRTYGFLTLKLMLENGWVSLGLYRDRRAVVRLRQKTRLKARLLDMQQRKSDSGKQSSKGTKSSRKTSTSSSAPAAAQPPSKPTAAPASKASRPPSSAASRRASLTKTPNQLTAKGTVKGKSAIELAEQQRRMQTFHVKGLSGGSATFRPEGGEMTAQQRDEERRTEQLARRTEKLHRRHPHTHTPTPNPLPLEAANAHTRTTDTGSGSKEMSPSDEAPSVSDTFTVQVATTLAKDSSDGSTRSMRASHHHHHHHHLHGNGNGNSNGKHGSTGLDTHTERYDGDDDADHLDTSAQQHRNMIKLRQDTFEPPSQQQRQHSDPMADEKRRERRENTTVLYARSDREEVTKDQQDVMRRMAHPHPQQHQTADGATTDGDCCSSESSCSSVESSSEDEEAEAEEAEVTNTPYTSRSLFYVLTNPPPDTILHARDRLYVLVQRWIKPESVHRMLNGQSLKEAQEAVDREQQELQQRDDKHGNSGRGGSSTPDAGTDGGQSVAAAQEMTFPRTYSGETGSVDVSLPQPQSRQQQQSPHTQQGGEQSIVSMLQQQLAQQQQMLQLIQRQLADLAAGQSGKRGRHQSNYASAHGTPTASGYSTPALQDVAASSQYPQMPMSSFPSASSRYQMPAEDESVSYELQRFLADNQSPASMQHTALRRANSTQSSASYATSPPTSPSPPVSAKLIPIAGAAHFGRPPAGKRGSSSSHVSITDASPSLSHSSLPLQARTVSGDFSSLLPSSSSSHLFSPTSQAAAASSTSSVYGGSSSVLLDSGSAAIGSLRKSPSSSLSHMSESSPPQSGQRVVLPPLRK